MKMIGMSVRSAATRFWRSRPLRSGRPTSSTRQLGARTRGRDRNSCADANVSACQPAQRISNSSDSRTEISSSTTNTVGMASVISGGPRFADPSVHSKCGIDRLKQSRLAERLEQTCHGPLCEQALTDGDRKSTRLNSSHLVISYAVFCLKKKKNKTGMHHTCIY